MAYLTYKNNELCFGLEAQARPLATFTKNYHKPVYIYDLAILRERYEQMAKALEGVQLYYAMKANSHPEILRFLAQAGAGADVVSGGEIQRALESGFKASHIVYSGVGKTRREIELALEVGVAQINAESFPEIERILEIAQSKNKRAPLALRLNPDVSIQTHPYIATGLKDNKFGMELKLLPRIQELFKKNAKHLELRGLSLHLGSMMMDFGGYQEALEKLVPIFQDLQKDFPQMDVFDMGGGLGVFYEKQDLAEEQRLLEAYAKISLQILKPLNARLQSEPGRWLVAHAGLLLSQVQYVKETSHKQFVILDTGMNHLLRPSLYGSHHGIWPLVDRGQKTKVDVVGPICESGDFFAKDRLLSRLKADDFLIIADAGAYGYSMANTYNLQDLPEEKILSENP